MLKGILIYQSEKTQKHVVYHLTFEKNYAVLLNLDLIKCLEIGFYAEEKKNIRKEKKNRFDNHKFSQFS